MKTLTLAIIKPDAVKAGHTGKIIDLIEKNGFEIVDMYKTQFTTEQAREFYKIHSARSFYNELVEFMTSGPIIVLALRKEDAVNAWRTLMGETDPAKAAPGTIRKLFGKNIGENATHGSDSPANAQQEVGFVFKNNTLI